MTVDELTAALVASQLTVNSLEQQLATRPWLVTYLASGQLEKARRVDAATEAGAIEAADLDEGAENVVARPLCAADFNQLRGDELRQRLLAEATERRLEEAERKLEAAVEEVEAARSKVGCTSGESLSAGIDRVLVALLGVRLERNEALADLADIQTKLGCQGGETAQEGIARLLSVDGSAALAHAGRALESAGKALALAAGKVVV
jgi:hypothetical protein